MQGFFVRDNFDSREFKFDLLYKNTCNPTRGDSYYLSMRTRVAQPPLRLRSVMPTVVMSALCLYFSFYLLFGPRGYLALQRIQETVAIKAIENQKLVDRREALEADVKLMRPKSLDADMAEEQARKTLGYIKPNEIVVNLK